MADKEATQGKGQATAKGNKVTPYIPSGLEAVMFRNNFYRNNYRRMVSLNLLLLLVICGLIGFIAYQHHTRPTPTYFATSTDGKILEVLPLNRFDISENELFQWAMEAARASYSYDFVNYRQKLQTAQQYYTTVGYNSLLAAIRESRNLELVKDKKMTTAARISGAPSLVQRQGRTNPWEENGRVTWEVQFPMDVLYTNGKPEDQIIQRLIVTLVIERVPVWDSSMGIGIRSIIVRENRPPPTLRASN